MRHRISVLGAVLFLSLAPAAPPEAGATAHAQGAAQQQPPPPVESPQVFRAGVNLVPVDVRVIDRKGNPVTNLLETDFTVRENGVIQQVEHFSWTSFTPDGTAVGRTLLRADNDPPLGSQNHRVFLIVLGRGRLQEPGKGVDGAIALIQNLLPQDYVGILAWNRATDLTSDHKAVLRVAERLRKSHEQIEALMKQQFSGLAAMYGGPSISENTQRAIDAVFTGPEADNVRTLSANPSRTADAIARSTRSVGEALLTGAIREGPGSGLGGSFREYVEMNAQSTQDLTNLSVGIEYLRHIAGEKHLVFVSEHGVFLPSSDDDRGLAAQASDARVAVSLLHTGGTAPMSPPMPPPLPLSTQDNAEAPGGVRALETEIAQLLARPWQSNTSQRVADLTGGQYASVQSGKAFFDRIDRASRFQYVLGYYSSRPVPDGSYRNISVRVNRPGLRVLFRHGYYARRRPTSLDRERNVTYSRVASAAGYGLEVRDIALSATVTATAAVSATQAGSGGQVAIDMKISPERLGMVKVDGRWKGAIDVAVFCGDAGNRVVGQSWNTLALEMTDEAHERFLTHGLRYTGTLEVTRPARYVKIVVYDAKADLIGSVIVPVK